MVTSRRWVVTRASTRGSCSVWVTCGRDRSAVVDGQTEKLVNYLQFNVAVILEVFHYCFSENNVQVFEAESVKTKHESSNEIHISSGNFKHSSFYLETF